MITKSLTDLDPATLAALSKVADKAAKATRDSLEPGVYTVDTILTLVLGAEVQVLKDQEGVVTPQKAKPWHLVAHLLGELNKVHAALGLAGVDLAKIVALAETVDSKIAEKAQKEADEALAAMKEPTRSNRRGAVKVKGEVLLPA